MGTLREEVMVGVTCWALKFHLFKALVLSRISLGTNRQSCGRKHGVYLIGKPTTTQLASDIAFDDIKEVFLTKEWNSFHFLGKKLDYLHLKNFLKYECEVYLKQPLTNTTTTQDHCVLTAPLIINLPLKLDNGRVFLSLEILDHATFALVM